MEVPELTPDLSQLIATQTDLPVPAAGIVYVQNPLRMTLAAGAPGTAFGVEGSAMNQGAAENVAAVRKPGEEALDS